MHNIVHMIFTMQVGGAENMLVDIANNQVGRANVTVVIVNNKYDKHLVDQFSKKIRLVFINRKEGSLSILPFLKIWKNLLILKPDIIHCHQHNLVTFLPFWKSKAVVTIHDVGIATHNLKKYKKVFVISKAVYNDLNKRCGLQPDIIYNGIVVDNIQRKSLSEMDTEQHFNIVQISRLYHLKKGQHISINAIKHLVAEGYTNVRLYFIGSGPSQHYLEELVAREGLEDYILFMGEKDRDWIYDNLKNFDVLLQPSIYEGFGLTIIEGISAGLPVIASNIEGPAEILHEMPSGFLFNNLHVEELVDVLKNVLVLHQQNKLTELCNASIEIVQKKYNINQTAHNYLLSYAS